MKYWKNRIISGFLYLCMIPFVLSGRSPKRRVGRSNRLRRASGKLPLPRRIPHLCGMRFFVLYPELIIAEHLYIMAEVQIKKFPRKVELYQMIFRYKAQDFFHRKNSFYFLICMV